MRLDNSDSANLQYIVSLNPVTILEDDTLARQMDKAMSRP